MIYTDYHITQSGKALTLSESKIIVNKYDNKTTRIFFNMDNTVTGRTYIALMNPITKKYRYYPLMQDNSVIITSNITRFPGVWTMLLLAVEDAIVDDELDQSRVTYVSNEFKRLVVRDNFLDDEHVEDVNDPAIDEALDNLMHAQDDILNASIQAQEALSETKVLAASVDEEIAEFKEYLTDEKTGLDAHIADEKTKISDQTDSAMRGMNNLIAAGQTSITDLKTDALSGINNLIAAGQTSLTNLRTQGEQSLSSLTAQSKTELTNTKDSGLTQINTTAAARTQEIENLVIGSKSDIEDLTEESIAAITQNRTDAVKEINQTKDAGVQEIVNVAEEKEAELRAIENSVEGSVIDAEAWAHGHAERPQNAKDNAKYYSDQAKASLQDVNAKAAQASTDAAVASQMAENASNYAGAASTSAAQASNTLQSVIEQANQVAADKETAIGASTAAGLSAQTAYDLSVHVAEDKQAVETMKNTVTTLEAATRAAKESVDNTASTVIGQIQAEGTTQTGKVTAEGTTQVDKVVAEGNTQIGKVSAEGTKQIEDVAAKGQEVLDSIPPNYTDLVDDIVIYGGEEPDKELNRIWIKENSHSVEVALQSDVDAVDDKVSVLNEEITHISDVTDQLRIDTDENKKVNDEQNRRLTNLEYASRGVLYREDVSESEDWQKSVPSDVMPFGTFDKIGGKTIVYNQLIGESYPEQKEETEVYEHTVEDKAESFDVDVLKGKTVVWNQLINYQTISATLTTKNPTFSDGKASLTFTASGTNSVIRCYFKEVLLLKGHKFYSANLNGKSRTLFGNGSSQIIISQNEIFTMADDFSANRINLTDAVERTANEVLTFEFPIIIDLTAMFGSGNEPDLETCKRIFTADYYPYSEPRLANVNAERVVSQSSNLLPFPYSQSIENGMEFDFSSGLHVKCNDDGTLLFTGNKTTSSENSYWLTRSDGSNFDISQYVGRTLWIATNVEKLTENEINIAMDIWTKNNGLWKAHSSALSSGAYKAFVVPQAEAFRVRLWTSSSAIGKMHMIVKPVITLTENAPFSKYHKEEVTVSTLIAKYFPTGMKSAGSVADEMDLKRGVAVQRFAEYTFTGNETWTGFTSQYPNTAFTEVLPDAKYGDNIFVACDKYDGLKSGSFGSYFYNGCWLQSSSFYPRFYVCNTSIVDIYGMRNSTKGMKVYYPLSTPIETPIDPADLAILRSIWCEEGGTITYQNALDIALPISVQETMNLTEWTQPLDSTHKYNHNGSLVTGVSSVAVTNEDYLIDMTRAGLEDIGAYVGEYEGKNDGELISADVTEMVVRGVNLSNNENYEVDKLYSSDDGTRLDTTSGWTQNTDFSEINPHTTYRVSSTAYIFQYDADKNYIGRLFKGSTADIVCDAGTRFVKCGMMNANHDTFMFYKKTDVKPSYKPYFEKRYGLEALIQKYFPDGMKSTVDLHDYIDIESGKAVKTVGSVDLGTLSWNKNTTVGFFRAYVSDLAIMRYVNMYCSKYVVAGNGSDSGMTNDKTLYFKNGNADRMISVQDSDYSTADEFRRSVQGVILYYPLLDEIVTPLLQEEIELLKTLQVEAGGSLKFIQNNNDFHIPIPNKETMLVKTGGVS